MQSSSLTPGIQDLGPIPDVTYTYSGTIPTGSTLSTSVVLPFSKSKVLSLIKFNVSGGSAGNYWFPLNSPVSIYENLVSNAYAVSLIVQSDPSGRKVNIVFTNKNAAAPCPLPTLTFTFSAHIYNYSW